MPELIKTQKIARCAVGVISFLALVLVYGAAQRTEHRIGADEVVISSSPYTAVADYSASANTVQVDVRVLNAQGQPATDLQKGDFRIEDDGRPQAIDNFERVTRSQPLSESGKASPGRGPGNCDASGLAPRSTLLYFDDLAESANDIAYAREKVLDFLGQEACAGRLPSGETIGVATGSGFGNLGFTADAVALRSALLTIAIHPRLANGDSCPLITPFQAWEIIHAGYGSDATRLAFEQESKCGVCSRDCETYVHDLAEEVWGLEDGKARDTLALLSNGVETLAHQPGRRTLVLTSTGFLTQEMPLQRIQQGLIDEAIRNNVVIDAIDAKGITAPATPNARWNDPYVADPGISFWRQSNEAGGFSMQDSAMWELAESTGGDFQHDNNDLRSGFERAVRGPNVYYSLSFAPRGLKADGAFHHLNVTVTAPGHFAVAGRYGYFSPTAETAPLSPEASQMLLRTLLGTDRETKLDGVIAASPATGGVKAEVRLNPNTLALRHIDGRHVGRVTLIFALFTPEGKFVTGRRGIMSLHLTDASLKQISRPGVGIAATANLMATAGAYRLRVVAYDAANDALMAITGKLTIDN
ncbi:MAG TPA: VWA domain-containing protein [Terriglobales bacterium]|nr:VWA domain-containing protein [Terriglobales bacterium]